MGARLRAQWVWKAGHQAKRFTFETSDLVEFSLLGWGYFWDPSSFLILYFSLSGTRVSILCLFHSCILGAHNFPGFTDSQLDKILP